MGIYMIILIAAGLVMVLPIRMLPKKLVKLAAGSAGLAAIAQQQMHRMNQRMDDEFQQPLLHQQMNDPYQNPGMDLVVDESFHGIDHGMGIANPDHNNMF
ncbi:hypothetical protein [Ammoniphilus resinae]|uniref:Uncharacterized protein n=1 Tax=Ammoniphilus resinae TaxID=861532 RepID=A0ABS4GPT9_9BACL|nr:hypothetical protein [Ammoniphilus resinae]MBP1932285.1 hypothetical protein [Ammoniphilus resinae]